MASMRAFTLVELLAALAVVAVLVVLALPALRDAVQDGQRTHCLSNMRQVGIALQATAGDSGGYYPPCVLSSTTWSYWDADLVWGQLMGSLVRTPAAIARSPFHCPSVPAATPYCYGLNVMFPSGTANYYSPRAVASIRQPSRCVLLGEGSNHAVDALWFQVGVGQKMLFPHQGRENFLYADLHAECLSTNSIPKGGWSAPTTGDPFWTGQ